MKKLIKFIAIIVALICLASIGSSYFSPITFWGFAFLSIGFKFIYLINFLFLLFYIFLRKKKFIIPLIPFILGFSLAQGNIQFFANKLPEDKQEEELLKLMSYNVRQFDFYNWSENVKSREKMVDLIKNIDADIFCIQEFYTSIRKNFNNVDTLIKYQEAQYYHTEFSQKLYGKDFYGIATFSKYPMINKDFIPFKNSISNMCIFTDVKINDDTVRIYNMHLQSFRFKKTDYAFIEGLKEIDEFSDFNEAEQIEGTKTILSRLKLGFKKRARQTDMISEHIKTSPYPVIVCGDFNDTPSSYVYRKIKGNLKDAFVESGRGLGTTYTGPFPEFRIDYILHDATFENYQYRTIRKKHSDHYPVTCFIDIHPNK